MIPGENVTVPCEFCGLGQLGREIWTATDRGWRVRVICEWCERKHAKAAA